MKERTNVAAEIGHLLVMWQLEKMIKDQINRHREEEHKLDFEKCQNPECLKWAESAKYWRISVSD